MTDFAREATRIALTKQGLPYIWGANGLVCWTPTKPMPTEMSAGCREAYDCVGLVKVACMEAGGPDLRWAWSCQELWEKLPPPILGEPRRLRLYGMPSHVAHVAIELGPEYVLEAAGGDNSTTSFVLASKRGAHVRVADIRDGRRDFLGFRSLAAMARATP